MSEDTSTWSWGCSKCKGQPEGDSKRKIRNCDGETNLNIAWDWMPSLRRCPWSQIDNETWLAFQWWREWKELSALPEGGTDIMAQPAYVVEAIALCEGFYAKVEYEKMSESKKELERSRRRNNRLSKG